MKPISRRDRYIATAALTYLLFALAWILVSEPLLALLVDPKAVLRLSLAKGLLFVLATAVLFYLALRGVPPPDAEPGQRQLDTDPDDPARLPTWVSHVMAVALTGVALGLRLALPVSPVQQPLLIVFVLPILLSALLGGLWPGLTATLLSTLAAAWLLWPAGQSIAAMPVADLLRLLVLLVSGLTGSAISGALRRSRARLAAQRNLLASVIDGTADAVFVKDLQGRYTLVNRAMAEFLGRPVDEVLGRLSIEVFPPASAERLEEIDRSVLSEGTYRTLEQRVLLPGGAERVFLVSMGPLREAAGRISGLFGISRDITDREQTAALLRENTAALNAAQRLAGTGSWSWNLRTDEHRWSEEVYRIYGLDPALAPAVFPEVLRYFSPETWADLMAAIDHTRATGEPYQCDIQLMRSDGTRRWVTARGEAVRGDDGTVVELRGTMQDTTERHLAEQKVRDSEARLQLVLAATQDGIWDWDVRSGRVYRSPRYFEVTGQDPVEDSQDFGFFDRMLHPEDREQVLATIAEHRAGRTPLIRFETRIVTAQGEQRWLRVQGQAVERAADGAPLRLVGMVTDVTEQQSAQAALRDREQQLERVIEGADVGYWDWYVPAGTMAVSARFETMLGHPPGTMDLRVEHWPALVHPDDWPQMQRVIDDHLAGLRAAIEMEVRVRTADGGWCWVLTRGRIVERAADGAPLRVAGTHTDIGERKAQALALREAATVFDSVYEGIMVVSPDMRVLKVNAAFTRITGYGPEEAVGQSPQLLASGRHDRSFYAEMRRTLRQHGSWRGELWNRRKDGSVYPEQLSITEVRNARGELEHLIGVFSDISQVKAHEAELDRIAHHDPLTGLPNRRLLGDRIRQAVAHAQRGGRCVAVCFLDLDGFKAVNDQHGHAVGDRLLVAVSTQMGRVLRADDTMARLGGDEFVLLLADLNSTDECRQVLDRVLASLAQPMAVAQAEGRESLHLSLTASIGVSLYPQDDGDPDTLLRHADQAMYRAKEAGKNRYQLFDPETDRQAQAHRKRLARLQQALDLGEFELHYQPKVDLADGRLSGVEALIRWRRPEPGAHGAAPALVPPGEFLPMLEGTPLEHAVGDWVIASGLAQAEAWHDQGLPLSVSVNVGANQLLQHDFADRLAAALARHPRLPRAAFELEVLESAAIADIAQAVTVMERCRELGVRFALDDFGTGYSSLTYLRRLPIDTLKIDQSFVRRMLDDAEDCGIVEGVIRLAAAFGREVIAEGVETAAHGERLLALGCRSGQGYGIARPMPAAQVADWAAGRLPA